MLSFKQFLKNQIGISIVDALLALGCISILISASINLNIQARKNTKLLFQINVRNKILSTLKMVLTYPTALRVSYNKLGNEPYYSCLVPQIVFDPTIVGGDCNNGQLTQFKLFGPMESTAGIIQSVSGELAGMESHPVEYNNLGAARDPNTGEPAAIVVTSWFRPYCPPQTLLGPPVAVCDVAEFIEFIVEVKSVFTDPDTQLPKLRTIRENVIFSVLEISNNPPAVNFTFKPPPPPAAPPPPPPMGAGGPPTPPPPPVICPGNTIQIGPSSCTCPPGEVLYNPRTGNCRRIAR